MFPRFRIIGLMSLVVVAGALLILSFRSPIIVSEKAVGTVSLAVDFGDAAREWENIPFVTGATAFSILKDITTKEQMPFVYDPSTGAGVFIRQIGDKKNGDAKKYWQYWVNGKYAMIAADQHVLAPVDAVFWKFTSDVPTNY